MAKINGVATQLSGKVGQLIYRQFNQTLKKGFEGLNLRLQGDADSGVRKGFGGYPEKKYSDVVDAIIKEYQD